MRGTLAGSLGGIGVGLVLNTLAPVLGLPSFGVGGVDSILVLVGLSLGAMLGDIVGSLFKRRMGLPRGASLILVDQLDFVFGSWALTIILAPGWFFENFSTLIIITVLAITPVLHRIANVIGYWIKAKKEPW